MYATGKDYKIAMAMGLSFTALTLCAEHSLVSFERYQFSTLIFNRAKLKKVLSESHFRQHL